MQDINICKTRLVAVMVGRAYLAWFWFMKILNRQGNPADLALFIKITFIR